MADEYGNDENENGYEQPEEQPSGLRKKLAEATKRASDRDALAEENAGLKQRLALSDAGLSLSEVQRTALLAVTPDLTVEALKTKAQELGFVAAPPPVQDDPSLAVHAQIMDSAAGTDAPTTDRDAEIDAQLAKATSEAEFMAIYRNSGRGIVQ